MKFLVKISFCKFDNFNDPTANPFFTNILSNTPSSKNRYLKVGSIFSKPNIGFSISGGNKYFPLSFSCFLVQFD